MELDGRSLTVENFMKIGNGEYRVKVKAWIVVYSSVVIWCIFTFLQLSTSAIEAVKSSRKVIDDVVDGHKGWQFKCIVLPSCMSVLM